jgi:hypothetical protein
MNAELKTKNAESVVSAVAIVVLLIVSLLGPVAMLVGSMIGLPVCVFLLRERLRGHGWLAAVSIVVAAALASAVAIAVSLA